MDEKTEQQQVDALCVALKLMEKVAQAASETLSFLEGRYQNELDRLRHDYTRAVCEQRFEDAGRIRDELGALMVKWSREAVRDRLRDALHSAGLL